MSSGFDSCRLKDGTSREKYKNAICSATCELVPGLNDVLML